MVDFNFTSPAAPSLDFVFGSATVPPGCDFNFAAGAPPPNLYFNFAPAGSPTIVTGTMHGISTATGMFTGKTGVQGNLDATTPMPPAAFTGAYDANVFRGLRRRTRTASEPGSTCNRTFTVAVEPPIFTIQATSIRWQVGNVAALSRIAVCQPFTDLAANNVTWNLGIAPAQALALSRAVRYVSGWPVVLKSCAVHTTARAAATTATMPYVSGWPLHYASEHQYTTAQPATRVIHQPWHRAAACAATICNPFADGLYPPFIWPVPVPSEPPELPPFTGDPNLNLICPLPEPIWGGVIFNLGAAEICQQALPTGWLPPGLIPRRVIIVTHDLFVKLLSDNSILDCLDVELSIDRDTWGWSWSANLFGNRPELIDGLHDVEISIDSHLWRGIIETMSGGRTRHKTRYRIGGRSLAANLSAPYTAPRPRTESAARTAIQLAEAELYSTGWTLDWQTIDWLVDAGCFSYADLTPIGAIKQIAATIDAIVQADRVNQTIKVLPRYAVSPWAIAAATPDITIPADILRSESVSFRSPALMRGVWVSGLSQGVRIRTYRTGSDGAPYARMIVDPLITHVDAGRERGRQALAATGRRRDVSLPMMLVDEVGILTPGMIAEITDITPWRGYIDKVKVNATKTKVTQTATIEQVLEV